MSLKFFVLSVLDDKNYYSGMAAIWIENIYEPKITKQDFTRADLLLHNLRKKNNLVYTSSASIMMKNGLLFIKAMTNKDNISIVKMIINELLNDLKNTKKYKKYIDTIINNYELNMNRELDNFYITSNYVINKYYETDLTSQEELVKLKNISLDELKEFINRMVLVCDYTLEGEL